VDEKPSLIGLQGHECRRKLEGHDRWLLPVDVPVPVYPAW
jgi:hypothetical protein